MPRRIINQASELWEKKNINKRARFTVEGCEKEFFSKIFTTLPQQLLIKRSEKMNKKKLCNRYRYEKHFCVFKGWFSTAPRLLSPHPPGWINSLLANTHINNSESRKAARQHHILVVLWMCTTEWNQFMLFNPHYDVVVLYEHSEEAKSGFRDH